MKVLNTDAKTSAVQIQELKIIDSTYRMKRIGPFMSNLNKSKRFDIIDKFNDTYRYLDDIFTIKFYNHAEDMPDIYPRELQLNIANTSDKETSFLDLNIKVICVMRIGKILYDKRDDFGFPI